MKTEQDCLPCFFRQIKRTLVYAGVNGNRECDILQKAAKIIEGASADEVPARTSTFLHRFLREEIGIDPYQQVKDTYNRIAIEKLPDLRRMAQKSRDQLEGSVRIAIAGNIIDFGIFESVDLDRSLSESFSLPLSSADYCNFKNAVGKARSILYLCDNAGEIVFDRVLIETLRDLNKNVVAVVKGFPVINDATRTDALQTSMHECATVIDNGNDGIGTLLELCSPHFMDIYHAADLIISKGQANFETLEHTRDPRIFYLFKVKCPVVATFLKRKDGDIILAGGGSTSTTP